MASDLRALVRGGDGAPLNSVIYGMMAQSVKTIAANPAAVGRAGGF